MENTDNNYRLIFSIYRWQAMRAHGMYPAAAFTEEEINNYDPKTGLIGTYNGVDCYVRGWFDFRRSRPAPVPQHLALS